MDFNGSFGDENNIIIKSIDKGDVAEDTKQEKEKSKNTNNINKNTNNDSFGNNNNIFSSVPLEMKIDNEYSNSNSIYDSIHTKELIKYNLSNIFNILKTKTIIIKFQTFHKLKNLSNKKINLLMNSELKYLGISSSFTIISKIFKKHRKKKLLQAFYKIKSKTKINDIFKLKFEMIYKKEKDNIINDNILKLKTIEKDIKDLETKIKKLNLKENELILDINNLNKKEKQLNDKLKLLENSKNNNINIIKQQSSNISSINNNSKYDSDIISLESTIETNKQLKEGKEEVIKNFIYKMNDLLNEYKVYIDMLYNNDGINNNININNGNNFEINGNSTHQSLNHKDKTGSENTCFTSKVSSGIQNNIK